ncbi:hypothetical protein A3860_29660 [Niastella vici]|uniref:Uncharacterized protein n=1 Tax=Niastella vici TaxID=1703345 RepID=A0A1V9FUS7_9BACT|nr:hypothetical protein [Niastella vici]OQP62119.1 hypothetical protein A3860_29660 [Niastella vici]
MMQTELLTKRNIATVGEEITHELGAKMIRDYEKANPADVKSFIIGKDIINQILAQPGCVGIQLFNAYNEEGKKTLVYVGLNADEKPILQYSLITGNGALETKNGLVGDRIPQGDGIEDWGWFFDE